MQRACKTCRYWVNNNTGYDEEGECHRHAPRAKFNENDNINWMYSTWAKTAPTDWCGEYKKDHDLSR